MTVEDLKRAIEKLPGDMVVVTKNGWSGAIPVENVCVVDTWNTSIGWLLHEPKEVKSNGMEKVLLIR